MAKWPWVSREQYELLQKQADKADAERLRLLDLLLERDVRKAAAEVAPQHVVPAHVMEQEAELMQERAETSAPAQFTTPFDRVEQRFATRFKAGSIPVEFRARVH